MINTITLWVLLCGITPSIQQANVPKTEKLKERTVSNDNTQQSLADTGKSSIALEKMEPVSTTSHTTNTVNSVQNDTPTIPMNPGLIPYPMVNQQQIDSIKQAEKEKKEKEQQEKWKDRKWGLIFDTAGGLILFLLGLFSSWATQKLREKNHNQHVKQAIKDWLKNIRESIVIQVKSIEAFNIYNKRTQLFPAMNIEPVAVDRYINFNDVDLLNVFGKDSYYFTKLTSNMYYIRTQHDYLKEITNRFNADANKILENKVDLYQEVINKFNIVYDKNINNVEFRNKVKQVNDKYIDIISDFYHAPILQVYEFLKAIDNVIDEDSYDNYYTEFNTAFKRYESKALQIRNMRNQYLATVNTIKNNFIAIAGEITEYLNDRKDYLSHIESMHFWPELYQDASINHESVENTIILYNKSYDVALEKHQKYTKEIKRLD